MLFENNRAVNLKSSNEEDLKAALETVAFYANSWFHANRLKSKLEKSELVIFGRGLRAAKLLSFKIISIGTSLI